MVRQVMLVVLAAVAGCTAKTEPAPQKDAPVTVSAAQVSRSTTTSTIDAVGSVALRRETPLGFTSDGRIDRVMVNEGDAVRRGQLLASLDTTSVEASLAAAQAEVRRANAEVARSAKLLKDGWVTRPRYETAVATADAATATLRARRFASDTARIYAPSSGVILARSGDPGQVVGAGAAVLTIGEAGSGYVLRLPLSDRDTMKIARGAAASVRLQGLENQPLGGRVTEIGGRSDRATGTFAVEVSLPPDARLRSGLIGTASITSAGSGPAQIIIVPPSAIFAARAGEAFVYVIGDDNRARLRRIGVGDVQTRGVRVTNGLIGGEWLAVSQIDRLRDGAVVIADRSAR